MFFLKHAKLLFWRNPTCHSYGVSPIKMIPFYKHFTPSEFKICVKREIVHLKPSSAGVEGLEPMQRYRSCHHDLSTFR